MLILILGFSADKSPLFLTNKVTFSSAFLINDPRSRISTVKSAPPVNGKENDPKLFSIELSVEEVATSAFNSTPGGFASSALGKLFNVTSISLVSPGSIFPPGIV